MARARALAAAITVVGLAGCAPSPPASVLTAPPSTPATRPAPTVKPSPFQCTPEAGGTPYACDQTEHDAAAARDATYAQAEDTYRKLKNAEWALYATGSLLGEEVAKYAMGDYLRDSAFAHQAQVKAGAHSVGEYRIASITRNPGASRGQSVISIVACIDAQAVQQVNAAGAVLGGGGFTRETAYFNRQIDGLKVAASEVENVAGC